VSHSSVAGRAGKSFKKGRPDLEGKVASNIDNEENGFPKEQNTKIK
jgi:hypothetical protein